jgi:uncharacterized membrane-anchored protein
VTGRLDAFEWREPPERVGQVIEPDLLEPPTATPIEPPAIEASSAVFGEKATGEVAPEKATGNVADSVVAPAAHAGTEADTRSGTAPTPPPDGGAIAPRPRRSTEGAQREARIPPPPDDPGVKTDESEEETAPGRFRLF